MKAKGSVVFNKRRSTWNYLYSDLNGKRKSLKLGSLAELPTKADAERKAQSARRDVRLARERGVPTVAHLVKEYAKSVRMPKRFSTSSGYDAWTKNHVLPHWGEKLITDVQSKDVEEWLLGLKALDGSELAPGSRVHIRGILARLWDFAMWSQAVPTQGNPMKGGLVKIPRGRKRKKPRSLTAEEFHSFLAELREPFRTIALVCICLGLRISECLGLKWSDVDWLKSTVLIERGIVCQRVGEPKSEESRKELAVSPELLQVFKDWKQTTEFAEPEDWIFASPTLLGRLPWAYPTVWQAFRDAAEAAGLGKLGTHTMRHTYRTWLDAAGTPVGVQQRLMRHADIRTTMNIYGDAATEDMKLAHSKVVNMALPKANGKGMEDEK